MTPNWTFGAGQADQLATLTIVGVTLVDFFGEAGVNGGTRFAQVRLTYHDGPLTWAVGMERPEEASDTLIPGFGSFRQMIFPAVIRSTSQAASTTSTAIRSTPRTTAIIVSGGWLALAPTSTSPTSRPSRLVRNIPRALPRGG